VTLLAAAVAAKSPSAWAEPGTLGFLVVFGMAVILYFVFRSMSKHLRKVREAAQSEATQAEAQTSHVGARRGDSFADDDYERQQREANAIDLDF
jgi:hypothetical protein